MRACILFRCSDSFIDNGVSQAYLANSKQVVGLIAGSILIIGLGLFDDVKGLGAKFKFTFEVGLAIGAFYLDYRIDSISNPFGPALELGWFALPITVLWIVGIINAINLIDGLMVLLAVCLDYGSYALCGVIVSRQNHCWVSLHRIGWCLIGFSGTILISLCYMGDSGSLFLGLSCR